MCVLCGEYVKFSGHSQAVLKAPSDAFGPVPEIGDLVGVTKDDISAISSTQHVTYEGGHYQKSWYDDPRTDFGTPITISYGFATANLMTNPLSRAYASLEAAKALSANLRAEVRTEFTTEQKNAVREILANISSFTNITFTQETGTEDAIDYSNILFSAAELRESGVASKVGGYARYPYRGEVSRASPTDQLYSGAIVVNNKVGTQGLPPGAGEGKYTGYVLAHEIGHALGLEHPHGAPSAAGNKKYLEESKLSLSNTIMSYRDLSLRSYIQPTSEGFNILNRFTSDYQHLDVLALQSVYGVNEARRGNDRYNFQAALDKEGETLGIQKVVTDPGGVDWFDGAASLPNRIDLNSGSWSDLGYGYRQWLWKGTRITLVNKDFLARLYKGEYNAIIAIDTEIENAKGGSEDDNLGGNKQHNVLDGGGGEDELRGYEGSDRLLGGAGEDKLDGGAGGDELDGGTGGDVVLYSASPKGVDVSLQGGYGEDGYDAWRDKLVGIEHVVGSNFGDRLEGDGGVNVLSGGGGKDVLVGGGGNDLLGGSTDDVGGLWGYGISSLRGLLPSGAKVSARWGESMAYERSGGSEVLVIGDPGGEDGFGRIDVFVRGASGVWEWKASERGHYSGSHFGKSVDIVDGYVGVGAPDSPKKQFPFTIPAGTFAYNLFDIFHLYKWTGSALDAYERVEKGRGEAGGAFLGAGLGDKVRLHKQDGKLLVSGSSKRTDFISGQGPVSSYGTEIVKDDTQKKFDLTYGYALGLTARGADALEVLDVADSGDVVGKDILFLSELNLLSGTPPLVLGLDTTIKSATVLRSAFFESGFFAMSSYASSGLQRGRALAVQGDLLVASIAIDVANLPTGASDLLTGVSGIVQIFRKASATDYKQEALLFDKSVSSDDNFGDSLALWSGGDYDYLAVGAPRLDTAAGLGRVYVYRYEGERGWFLYDTVLAATSTVRGFGTDVTFTSDGDLVVSSSDGNIYVYDFVSLAPKVSGGGLGDGTGDRLFGGDGDDILRSGTGADVLDGGSGTDEVFYADYSANYSFVSRGHVLEVTINGVTDRLYNIERIKFLDKTFELEKGTASGSVVETVGLKLKLPAVTDVTLPVASSKSASVTKDSVMVKVTPSEGGRMYVLVREEDGGLPSVMDVVIDGEEVLVVGGTMKTLTVDGLSSGTDYVPYVVLEDGSGNFSGVIAVETEVTTGASVLSNLGSTKFGSYRHEVSFELDGDGFVYYAYKLSGSKPGAAEMRSGPSGSSLSGVTWVADGGVSHKIYLPSLGAGKVYVMSDGEGVVHEVEVSSSWVDDEMWGLSFGSDFLG